MGLARGGRPADAPVVAAWMRPRLVSWGETGRQAPETDVQLQRPVSCPSLGGIPARTLGHTSQNVNLAQKRMSVIAELGGGCLRSSILR